MLYNTFCSVLLEHQAWQMFSSKQCVTGDSSDYLTYKTKENLNFPFYAFSHLFMPNQFFEKKKGQELKQNN